MQEKGQEKEALVTPPAKKPTASSRLLKTHAQGILDALVALDEKKEYEFKLSTTCEIDGTVFAWSAGKRVATIRWLTDDADHCVELLFLHLPMRLSLEQYGRLQTLSEVFANYHVLRIIKGGIEDDRERGKVLGADKTKEDKTKEPVKVLCG